MARAAEQAAERYSDIVDYGKLDPVKRLAMELFAPTLRYTERLGIRIPFVGDTAAAFDTSGIPDVDFILTTNIEGLGTKNLIADEMWRDMKDPALYSGLGIDNEAMSANDNTAAGADVFFYMDIIASGDDSWFEDHRRTEALLQGYRTGADQGMFAIPCGETPTLMGIVGSNTLDMAGASIGIVRPRSRLLTGGEKLMHGDRIFGLSSSGIHSNGVSKTRRIAGRLPDGYFTQLGNGKGLGREMLTPTCLYTRPLMDVFDAGVDVHYAQPITGHGWEKIMRAKRNFTYEIDNVPEPPMIFQQLIEFGMRNRFDVSHRENYYVWNMGVGFVVFAPSEYESSIRSACSKYGIEVYNLGTVVNGERKVWIKPLGVVFK